MSTPPDEDGDWIGTAEAAEILGVVRQRVRQLVEREFLPAIKHKGRLYYRRHQVEVIANAREARWRSGGSLRIPEPSTQASRVNDGGASQGPVDRTSGDMATASMTGLTFDSL